MSGKRALDAGVRRGLYPIEHSKPNQWADRRFEEGPSCPDGSPRRSLDSKLPEVCGGTARPERGEKRTKWIKSRDLNGGRIFLT